MYSRRQKRRNFYVVPSHRTPKRNYNLPAHDQGFMSGEGIFHKKNQIDLRTAIREHLQQQKIKRTPIDKLKVKAKGQGLSLTSRNRQVDTLLRKMGNTKIKSVQVCRKPIHRGIRRAVDLLTLNKSKEINKEMDYVDMYHLFLYVYLMDGKVFKIHKNAVVDVEYNGKVPVGSTCISKSGPPTHTVAQMIMKSEKVNKQLYKYNAQRYNCQNFVATLLKAIGLYDSRVSNFIMQDYSDLFTPVTSAIAQGITNAKALFDRLIGKGLTTTGNGLTTTGNGLTTTGNGLTTTGTHGGDGLMLTGQTREVDIFKPHIPKVPNPIDKKKDPLKKLRGRVKPVKPVKPLRVKKLVKEIKGQGMPSRKDIEKFLKDHLKEELEGHVNLTKAHLNRILKHFKLHPDNNSLVKHAIHLSHMLTKHYYKSPKKGKGLDDIIMDEGLYNAQITKTKTKSDTLLDKTMTKLSKELFNLILKAIKSGLKKGKGQSGEGLKKKAKKIFKDIGHFLKKHRKDIAQGVSTGSKVAAALAVAMGQPELVVPLKMLEKAGDIAGKDYKSPVDFLDTAVSEITGKK